MAKITLDTITSSFASTSLFNTNFTAIKDELNNKVLYRDNPTGEANQMLNDLDMNSNDILNASSVNADVIVLNGTQITPTGTTSLPAPGLTYDNSTSGLTASNVQDAIDEVDSTLDTVEIQQAQGQNYGKNLIINGDFSVWQRGTSQTTDGYGSADRAQSFATGSAMSITQQAFTLGQTDVPNNPKYFFRDAVTSVAGAGNGVTTGQNIEDVTKTSGKEVTLSFWAKADAAKNIATEFFQNFGTGGSPSASVTGIGSTTHSLTTSWQKFTTTVTIPSVSGKTLGSNNNNYLRLIFWFEAGSDFDARTNSLGQQSGTFDIANVQLEFGDTATEFEYVHPADQLARCQRYFEILGQGTAANFLGVGHAENSTSGQTPIFFTEKRAIPSFTVSDVTGFSLARQASPAISTNVTIDSNGSNKSARLLVTVASGLTAGECVSTYSTTGAAYVSIDAEL